MGDVIQRKWGTYEVLSEGPRYKVKRLIMEPGQTFSHQWHRHRSEIWTVVRGFAEVVVNRTVRHCSEGTTIIIDILVDHKLTNPGQVPVEIIEVQYGTYLGEDDIIRLD